MSPYQPNQSLPPRKPSPRQVRQFRAGNPSQLDPELEIVAPVPKSKAKPEGIPLPNPAAQLAETTTAPVINHQQILNTANAAICQFRILTDYRMLADYRLLCDYASAGTEAILGYAAAELRQNPYLWRTQIWPADWDRVVMPALQKLLRVTQADPQRYYKSQIEFRFQRKSGYPGWMSTTLSCRFDPDQQCWHLTVVQIEIPAVDLQRRVVPNQAQETLAAHTRAAQAQAQNLALNQTQRQAPVVTNGNTVVHVTGHVAGGAKVKPGLF